MRRATHFLAPTVLAILAAAAGPPTGNPGLTAQEPEGVVNFVRYEHEGETSYGVLRDNRIMEIDGDIFGAHRATDRWVELAEVELLTPTDAGKVIAVGLNYQSHLGDREPASYPGLFAKYPTSLIPHGADIPLPADASNLHYEGEMVLVIGRRCSDVSREEAMACVFGVTAGNDVSERDWQSADLQWLRAKASDGFGPVGPTIARGIDPDDVLVQTRVNGEVRQSERTADLLFDTRDIVSYVSGYVTLEPGDLIFTGTPGSTRAMSPGDVVEVEVEGVGVLRNTVRRP